MPAAVRYFYLQKIVKKLVFNFKEQDFVLENKQSRHTLERITTGLLFLLEPRSIRSSG